MTSIAYAIVRSEGHFRAGHPEHPDRFQSFHNLPAEPIANRLREIPHGPLEGEALLGVHRPTYVERLEQAVERAPSLLDTGDTYLTRESLSAAREAAGAAVAVTNAVLEEEGIVGFSLARPPGHHATPTRGMGFCLVNHVALAVREAQSRGVGRILILDFDVHHGNGTQEIFYDDPAILYISLHQRGIFPGTGRLEERGIGAGEGATINVPLPAFVGHEGYLHVLEAVLERASDRFQPDLLLVSAGYDAHWRDPLAHLQLSAATYHRMGRLLMQCAERYCGGRLSCVLEGGYDPGALYDSVLRTMEGILGLPPTEPEGDWPAREEPDPGELLERVLQLHELG